MQFLYEQFKKYGSVFINTEGRSVPEVSITRETVRQEIVSTLRGMPAIALLWGCVLIAFSTGSGLILTITGRWWEPEWVSNEIDWSLAGPILLIWTLSVAVVGSFFNQRGVYYRGTAVKEHLEWQRTISNFAEEIRSRRQLVNQLEADLIADGYSDAAALLKSYGKLKSRTSIATYDDYLDSLEDEEDC